MIVASGDKSSVLVEEGSTFTAEGVNKNIDKYGAIQPICKTLCSVGLDILASTRFFSVRRMESSERFCYVDP